MTDLRTTYMGIHLKNPVVVGACSLSKRISTIKQIEEAGVHSGDSACSIPPYSLPGPVVQEIREATHAMAKYLNVVGLMNVQYAVKKENGRFSVYVLEVNPRASRTVPFVAKATGVPVAKLEEAERFRRLPQQLCGREASIQKGSGPNR